MGLNVNCELSVVGQCCTLNEQVSRRLLSSSSWIWMGGRLQCLSFELFSCRGCNKFVEPLSKQGITHWLCGGVLWLWHQWAAGLVKRSKVKQGCLSSGCTSLSASTWGTNYVLLVPFTSSTKIVVVKVLSISKCATKTAHLKNSTAMSNHELDTEDNPNPCYSLLLSLCWTRPYHCTEGNT